MKKLCVYITGIVNLVCCSCSDFLSQYPLDQEYPSRIEDFDELLVGEGYASNSTKELNFEFSVMDDDALYETKEGLKPDVCDYYYWAPELDTEATWQAFYKHIGVANVVLDGINKFKNSSEEYYRKVKGEAYFLRGAYYYYLVNLYAKPYSPKTASKEPGVPLKLNPYIEDKKYSRQTVEEVYRSIVGDLIKSIDHLKGIRQLSSYRANEMAVRLLLSRVYLYMGNWKGAFNQCDTILKSPSCKLLNYNELTSAYANVTSGSSVETLFTSGGNKYRSAYWNPAWGGAFRASDELLNLYEAADLRLVYCYRNKNTPMKMYSEDEGIVSDYFILRTPEAYLNKAEAAVMLGKDEEAIKVIRELYIKRIKRGAFREIKLSQESLLNFIREERRREYAFEGQRWFDLRRYAVSPRWPLQKEIFHPYYNNKGQQTGNIILKKYNEDSRYYVLPLPENEVNLNQGSLVPNEARDKKEPTI